MDLPDNVLLNAFDNIDGYVTNIHTYPIYKGVTERPVLFRVLWFPSHITHDCVQVAQFIRIVQVVKEFSEVLGVSLEMLSFYDYRLGPFTDQN